MLFSWIVAVSLLVMLQQPSFITALSVSNGNKNAPHHYAILGGTGRVGTAIAKHLNLIDPEAQVTLVTRRSVEDIPPIEGASVVSVATDCWKEDNPQLQAVIDVCDCLIHTAGPYLPDQRPTVLQKVLQSPRCRVYLDISDPLPFLESHLELNPVAKANKKTCLLAAGAFPGMSNVLGMEAAAHLPNDEVHNVYYQFFTSGLGGIGNVNLYITNLGFGEPMTQMEGGKLRPWSAFSGRLLGRVDFGNNIVGTQQIFAWPFPEAATVAKELNATGDSFAGMGTAPDIWNNMMGLLVDIVPRSWWRFKPFSKFMADFSQPLVTLTDAYLKAADAAHGTGETHAMRIDVTRRDSSGVTILQGHRSFRDCVGQSAAEFALDCLQHEEAGVYLPEQRYRDQAARTRIIDKLTRTPGTLWYSGAVMSDRIYGPSELQQALTKARADEVQL